MTRTLQYPDLIVCAVYKITCSATGDIYIGAANNVKARWQQHIGMLNANTHHSKLMQEIWRVHRQIDFFYRDSRKSRVR